MPEQIPVAGNDSTTWDASYGVTQRIVNIINQCRYLSSKRGMNLKEIRLSMRADEARQRQIFRNTACSYPFLNINNHGMIYSQYNVQNYGQNNSAPTWNYKNELSNRRGHMKALGICSEDSLPKTNEQKQYASLKVEKSTDNLMNLLYAANLSTRPSVIKNNFIERNNHNEVIYNHRLRASSSELSTTDGATLPIPFKEDNGNMVISHMRAQTSESEMKYSLPGRKLGSHDLASLYAAEKDVESNSEEVTNFNSTLDFEENSNSDSEVDYSEIQVVEEMDKEKAVKSPLIKQVESAFADLQKKDALFGTVDDFGDLMSEANRILG